MQINSLYLIINNNKLKHLYLYLILHIKLIRNPINFLFFILGDMINFIIINLHNFEVQTLRSEFKPEPNNIIIEL